jgi:hemerythrin-like metal-binding protein
MIFFEWSPEYNTNVEIIDKQHQRLVEIINELYTAVMEIRGQEVIKGVIKSLVEYAVIHFRTEEEYMLKYNYPGFGENKKEHENFSAKVAALQAQAKSDDFILSIDVLNFLKDWLQHHILVVDMQYKSFFQSKGVK